MAGSGSENRQRRVKRTVRLTLLEDAALRTLAAAAGVPVSTFIRCAALDFPLPRTVRQPSINHEVAAALLGRLGEAATAFRSAATHADPKALETAMNDFAEYRLMVFEALGRKP